MTDNPQTNVPENILFEEYLKGIDSAISYVAFRGHEELAQDMIKELYERKKKLKLRDERAHYILSQFFSPDYSLYTIQKAAETLEAFMEKIMNGWTTTFLVDVNMQPRQIDNDVALYHMKDPHVGARFFVVVGEEETLRRLDIDLSANIRVKRTFLLGTERFDMSESEMKDAKKDYWEEVEEWELEMKEGAVES